MAENRFEGKESGLKTEEDPPARSPYVFDWKNPNMGTMPVSRRSSASAGTEKVQKPAPPRRTSLTESTTEFKESKRSGEPEKKNPEKKRIPEKTQIPEKKQTEKKFVRMSGTEEISRLQKKKKKKRRLRGGKFRTIALAVFILLLILCAFLWWRKREAAKKIDTSLPDYVTEDYLTVNPYSRPGISTREITGVVIHYTANPGTTAEQNRDYFEGLAESKETRASSNFIIGLDGEVLACVPVGEIAYASNDRNSDTVSIECCHEDETGEFNEATYESLVKLTAYLCNRYSLATDEILRHYDVTGKNCPKYFVENEDAWEQFKKDVKKQM